MTCSLSCPVLPTWTPRRAVRASTSDQTFHFLPCPANNRKVYDSAACHYFAHYDTKLCTKNDSLCLHRLKKKVGPTDGVQALQSRDQLDGLGSCEVSTGGRNFKEGNKVGCIAASGRLHCYHTRHVNVSMRLASREAQSTQVLIGAGACPHRQSAD